MSELRAGLGAKAGIYMNLPKIRPHVNVGSYAEMERSHVLANNVAQHIYSKFAIKHFLGDQNGLFCLNKSTLIVPERATSTIPKHIFREDNYCTIPSDDFDSDEIKPLENKFSPFCADLVKDHETVYKQDGAWDLLVDWCAMSLARSRYFAQLVTQAATTLSPAERSDLPVEAKPMTLVGRRAMFYRLKHQMRAAQTTFRFLRAACPFDFLLTDHPAFVIPRGTGGNVGPLMLPLSHDLMLIQVPLLQADQFFSELGTPSNGILTLMQCGWAGKKIYSASLKTLDFAAEMLRSGERFVNAEMAVNARKPYFGIGVVSASSPTL